MTKPIGPGQRERLERLVAAGEGDEALRLLAQWVKQQKLTPWAMEWLGRMHLARGDRVAAGQAFLWAGVREGDEVQAAIAAFLRRTPRQLLMTLRRCARVPFDRLPTAVQADLGAFGVDAELAAKLLAPPPPKPLWMRLVVGGFHLVFAGIVVIGFATVMHWLFRGAAGR